MPQKHHMNLPLETRRCKVLFLLTGMGLSYPKKHAKDNSDNVTRDMVPERYRDVRAAELFGFKAGCLRNGLLVFKEAKC